ncbi:toll-like receptor 6 [Tachypleus tridentatus]
MDSTIELSPLQNLQVLNLSFNNITFINHANFANVSTVSLDLRGNKLEPWTTPIFSAIAHLSDLHLESSSLTVLNRVMLKDLEQIENVSVENNPWDCLSCDLVYLQQWLQNQQSKRSDFSSYKCHYPKSLRNTEVLEAQYNVEACVILPFNVVLYVVTPLTCVTAFLITLVSVCYWYRWYIRYFLFLCRIKVTKFREKKLSDSYLYDAFISYCDSDLAWVAQKLVPMLENPEGGLRLCLHDRNFLAGLSIEQNIIESIDKSRKTVFILSPSFLKSQWCMYEIQIAQHRLLENNRNSLVLVKMKNLPQKDTTKELQYLLRTRTYLEWPENSKAQSLFWLRLRNALTSPCRNTTV